MPAPLVTTLAISLGTAVAEKLIKGLSSRKGGPQKLEAASAALAQGASAIDALKTAFGKDFLLTLNEAIGTTGTSRFSYEAGTQSYVRVDDTGANSTKLLRDELNINLDRLAVLDVQSGDLKSQFKGLMSVWKERCRQFLSTTHGPDIETTFQTIDQLLNGESRNYRQIYQLLSATSLGGVGALMIISGVLVATGTGVGIVSGISMFLFGIPWLTVGALVLPGALLLVMTAKKTRPSDEMSLSVALAYKLLERIDAKIT